MEIYTSFIIGNTCFVTAEVFSKWVSLKEQDSKKKKGKMPLTVQLFHWEAEIILRWLYLL